MSRFLRSHKAVPKAEQNGPAAVDEEFCEAYPALAEYLTLTVDDEGETRKTATLMFFAEDGVFKACLNDRQSDASLWAASETFVGALEALEALLEAPTAQWRVNGKRTKR